MLNPKDAARAAGPVLPHKQQQYRASGWLGYPDKEGSAGSQPPTSSAASGGGRRGAVALLASHHSSLYIPLVLACCHPLCCFPLYLELIKCGAVHAARAACRHRTAPSAEAIQRFPMCQRRFCQLRTPARGGEPPQKARRWKRVASFASGGPLALTGILSRLQGRLSGPTAHSHALRKEACLH